MIETIYSFAKTDQKAIERIIDSDHLALNHIVLPEAKRFQSTMPARTCTWL